MAAKKTTKKPADKKKRPVKKPVARKNAAAKKKRAPAKKVQPIPAGYSAVIPCFRVTNCASAILFLQQVFGARITDRHDDAKGAVMHCELRVGDVTLMCGEAHEGDVQTLAACMYVEDCDAVFDKAVRLGAKIKQALTDQFYGDRSGRVQDEWGNEWVIATHIEDVSRQEMERRMQALMNAPQTAAG